MKILQGTGVVPGIGIAKVKVLSRDLTAYLAAYKPGNPTTEAKRLAKAIKKSAADLLALKEAAKASGKENQAEIIEAHVTMVNDPSLSEAAQSKICLGMNAPNAVLEAAEEFAAVFEGLPDLYLRGRAADVRDVGRRIASLLVDAGGIDYGTEPIVLCAAELEPSLAASMPEGQVQGLLLGQGSTTSHTVIIAKARGIPVVTGLGSNIDRIPDGVLAIVDGDAGEVIIKPASKYLTQYRSKVLEQAVYRQQEYELSALSAVTKDGRKIQLAANIGSPNDMTAALKHGAEGVGLFRSEFLFLGRDVPPTEDEQFTAYKEAVQQCGEHLCVIRTMDIGGDKQVSYLNINKEENPFLGLRGIRISLERPDIFITQLKAILRAGVFGRAAIMLPMVISAAEITKARQYVNQAAAALNKEGKRCAADIPLGIMVETPAAAIGAGELAGLCDFFSIGTNDLVQYTLAVDRGNPAVSMLYSYFHPAVLRLISGIVKAGHDQGIWVGMCGEMAGDPVAVPLLAAMGFNELSMSAPAIPRVKAVIRNLDSKKENKLLCQAMALADAESIRRFLLDYSGLLRK